MKPKVQLTGQDGNAFFILGRCKQAADKAKWTPEQWKEFSHEAKSGDYDNLLRAVMKYFNWK